MNKNMNSPTKLTEFAPLSPEESQPVVASLFSKLFGFSKGDIYIFTYIYTYIYIYKYNFFRYSTFLTFITITDSSTGSSPSNENSVPSPNNDERSSSGESDLWKCIDENAMDKSQEEEDNASSTSSFPLDASEGRSLPNVLKRISNIVALKSSVSLLMLSNLVWFWLLCLLSILV